MRKVYFKKPYAFRTGWDAMTLRMFLSYRKEKGRRIERPVYSIRQIWAARTFSFHAARHDVRRQKPKPKGN